MTRPHPLLLAALLLAACGAEAPAGPVSHPPPLQKVEPAAKPFVGHMGIENGWITLHVEQPAFREYCVDEPKLEKLVDGRWVPVQDDRPPPELHPGYYVDDVHIHAAANEGCDMRGCGELRESWRVAEAAEFVRTGTRPDPAGKQVDQLQKRPLSVPVRALVKLHRNARCDGAELATFTQQ